MGQMNIEYVGRRNEMFLRKANWQVLVNYI